MADTVNIQTNIWETLVADTLANVQNILNDAYNLFDKDHQIFGKDLGSFKWVLDGTLTGDMQNVDNDSTELTTTKILQKTLQGIILRRGNSFIETALRQLLTGDKLNMIIATDLMRYIALQMAKNLASTLTGGFAATSASALKIDLSTNTGVTAMLTHDQIPKLITKAYPNLNPGVVTTLIVHGDVYNNIRDHLTTGYSIQDQLINNITIPNIMGVNLVSNNQLCTKTDGGDDPDTYTSYMCWEKAFSLNLQRPMDLYRDFYPKVGGGTSEVTFYENFAIAPKGVSWKGVTTGSPTTTALEVGTNWEWLYHDVEQVPIRQITSTIVATVAST